MGVWKARCSFFGVSANALSFRSTPNLQEKLTPPILSPSIVLGLALTFSEHSHGRELESPLSSQLPPSDAANQSIDFIGTLWAVVSSRLWSTHPGKLSRLLSQAPLTCLFSSFQGFVAISSAASPPPFPLSPRPGPFTFLYYHSSGIPGGCWR